MAVALVSVT